MENIQFNEDELKYINADIYDKSQNVHIEKYSRLIINTYNISCNNLPIGTYTLDINLNLPMTEYASMFCGYLRGKLIDNSTPTSNFSFNILDNCRFLLKTQYPCRKSTIQNAVLSLRTQAVVNARNLSKQEQSLIARDIKSHTNLGEDYNRESFYATIYECLANDETLEVDTTKPVNNCDTKNLRLFKIMQEKNRLQHQINDLNNEEQDLLKL